ncbi:MAG: hypothetical protein ABIG44_17575 [Planctomycetota bacterium]
MPFSISSMVVLTVASGGLALAGWALFGDRSRATPRCPQCWYLMIGATGMRCPECGHTVAETGDFYRTQRRWRWAALGTLIALGTPGYTVGVRCWDDLLLAILPRWEVVVRQRLGSYTLEISDDRRVHRPMRARIIRDGEIEFALTAWGIRIGAEVLEVDRGYRGGVGQDITGDGIPDLVLEVWNGGSHCCWAYYVLSLGPEDGPQISAPILAGHDVATWRDMDADGRLECIVRDWTFAWWSESAIAPAPEVILCCRGGQYVAAAHLMSWPAPSEVELIQFARRVREDPPITGWGPGTVPEEYWAEMLELIYTGHEELAWWFAEEAWPKTCPGKEEFLASFRRQLNESPYWPAIRAVGLP